MFILLTNQEAVWCDVIQLRNDLRIALAARWCPLTCILRLRSHTIDVAHHFFSPPISIWNFSSASPFVRAFAIQRLIIIINQCVLNYPIFSSFYRLAKLDVRIASSSFQMCSFTFIRLRIKPQNLRASNAKNTTRFRLCKNDGIFNFIISFYFYILESMLPPFLLENRNYRFLRIRLHSSSNEMDTKKLVMTVKLRICIKTDEKNAMEFHLRQS